ncbi:ATP-binding cassette domain-containing protein [Pseudoalteromonas sp. APC 3893]|nr:MULTISPECIES: ATP-binding cassette domain-containing protein [unclassified Pseudoalteromonas]MDN3377864.1 ATP-binding cassette domain-containing protein [Pseudoalteromonas sp. APC 3893]MDN3386059.1 ATP-binding cassette domain-containing protein [Pseudoalteromonas sp. APC 4017]
MSTPTAINQTSPIKSQRPENINNSELNNALTAKSEAIIEVNSLSFSIKNNAILKNLNFTVGSGEIYALLGGKGAGKSTTLKTLLGFNKPT